MGSNMFQFPDKKGKLGTVKTVNPFNGCRFRCYNDSCWAAVMAKRHRGMGTPGYGNGFEPSAVMQRMRDAVFRGGEMYAVGLMGDIYFQPKEVWSEVFRIIEQNPETDFLVASKNPGCFGTRRSESGYPDNVVLSTTIETNRYGEYESAGVSEAPHPLVRARAMREHGHPRKHVSIEPVLDFDVSDLVEMVKRIAPERVAVGYATLHAKNRLGLPEPSLDKTRSLIEELEGFTAVDVKEMRPPVDE